MGNVVDTIRNGNAETGGNRIHGFTQETLFR